MKQNILYQSRIYFFLFLLISLTCSFPAFSGEKKGKYEIIDHQVFQSEEMFPIDIYLIWNLKKDRFQMHVFPLWPNHEWTIKEMRPYLKQNRCPDESMPIFFPDYFNDDYLQINA